MSYLSSRGLADPTRFSGASSTQKIWPTFKIRYLQKKHAHQPLRSRIRKMDTASWQRRVRR